MAMMASRRVLMVGGEGVVLYVPAGKGVRRETSLSWDVPNFEQQLSEILADKSSGKSVTVLFDGADQTYRKEDNIPKMSFIDRRQYVKRKLELAFPSYAIRAALEIKPPKGKAARGAAPSYLFVALPEAEQLDRVGTSLFESGASVAGFGLLPAEASGLVTELAKKVFGSADGKRSRWSVLVGQHETGGLRQVVVRDGNLALTRLTPTSEAGTSGAGWAEEVLREFRATLTYISRFGYTQDDGLDVMFVCGNIEKQFFSQKDIGIENFRCLTPAEALHHLGATTSGLDKTNFADALHAAWVGRKSALRLPIRVPSIHKVTAPRQAARFGSFALCFTAIGLVLLTAQTYVSYGLLKSEIAEKQNRQMMLDREYAQESKVFDGLPVRPEIAKAALSVKTLLNNNTAPVASVLSKLKTTLGNEIKLEELNYKHESSSALNLDGTASGGLFAAAPDPNDKGRIRVNFKFGLPDSLILEQKVKRAEEIAEALRAAFAGYNIRIVSQFGKVEKDSSFSGTAGSMASSAPVTDDFAEIELEGVPF